MSVSDYAATAGVRLADSDVLCPDPCIGGGIGTCRPLGSRSGPGLEGGMAAGTFLIRSLTIFDFGDLASVAGTGVAGTYGNTAGVSVDRPIQGKRCPPKLSGMAPHESVADSLGRRFRRSRRSS